MIGDKAATERFLQADEATMNTSTLIQKQLLATKFFVPVTPGTLISRPRLIALLDEGLKFPFTLVSASAGFGKTTLLSTWAHSLQAPTARLCWISLDEEDNDPRLFWTSVLTALDVQGIQRFEPLLMHLQSQPPPPLKALLTALINLLAESQDHFVLILDDYQLITEQQVHTTLAYLIEHLPPQLRIIVATRADPPLPFPLLRARGLALEVRTDQLRCTPEETRAFLDEVMHIHLPDQTIQKITTRTEGWLVGLQLLGLSLPDRADPEKLLKEISGNQRYILDYLTEVVLRQQPPEMQTFLLSTCILEQLNASLCDAILEQTGSQEMLQRLERANLFVVSLDSKREWYRYHALFAEALSCQLEKTQPDLVLILHHRASLWYAKHNQTTQAILHAFKAHEWHWAVDLIEQAYSPLVSFTLVVGRHTLVQFQQWIEQLPADILACRPHLCLACIHLLWTITPHALLFTWLDMAEATLRAPLKEQTLASVSQRNFSPQAQQEQMDLLGKILTDRTYLSSYLADGQATFALYEQALALLSPEDAAFRAIATIGKSIAYYSSSANNAMAAIESGYQAALLTQEAKQPVVTFIMRAMTAIHLIGAGHLHKAEQLTRQTSQLETLSDNPQVPWIGWVTLSRAEILREWNELADAQSLATEAISLCEQATALIWPFYLYWGHAVMIRVCLSCGDVDAARTFLYQAEQIGRSMNQQIYLYLHSCFTTVDQVRLWLACGERDRAIRWAEELDLTERHGTPFTREREEVACARILLAKQQPVLALQRLEPVLQRATTGQRWGHVVEIRLLQALASHMLSQETEALNALCEAVRLAEPEGYIRSFVDEGAPMETLLYRLRESDLKRGPTPYLDTLLAAFQQESRARAQAEERTQAQALPEPLSERELQVLQLLARGASNLEIAHELVIVVDTVKRHVSHILGKLGVNNRLQAVRQAQDLGLLDEEF